MSDESAAPEEGVTPEAEATEAPEAEAEAPATDEAPAAEEAPEAAEEPVAEAEADEPVADEAPEAAEEPLAAAPGTRVARVFFCDRGHRTTSLWSEPTVCKARPVRSGPECGRQLFPVGELPEQVVKALNPLKASKKAAKKG